MEVSFLKDAIDRVAEMAKPFTFEFAGRQFCSAELHEIRPEVDFPARYSVWEILSPDFSHIYIKSKYQSIC